MNIGLKRMMRDFDKIAYRSEMKANIAQDFKWLHKKKLEDDITGVPCEDRVAEVESSVYDEVVHYFGEPKVYGYNLRVKNV